MSRFNVVLSEELDDKIEEAAKETGQTKSDVLRKSLALYFTAREADSRGLKLGLVDKKTDVLKTEIIGL